MRLIHQGKPVQSFAALWLEAERRAKHAELIELITEQRKREHEPCTKKPT